MKWKDSADMADEETPSGDKFFDEERYSPWADGKEPNMLRRLNRMPILFVLLLVSIVALVAALVMLLWGGNGNGASQQSVRALEDRVRMLEERLDKYEAIDEKVTRIWEQAKSFEKFKDRFDRSEASTSLRMDHLTMSLETLQKQMSGSRKAETPPVVPSPAKDSAPSTVHYHKVAPGETFFSISKQYGLTVEELLRLNQMNKNDVLQIGQNLIVGGSAASQ